jgi:hypothetical protein
MYFLNLLPGSLSAGAKLRSFSILGPKPQERERSDLYDQPSFCFQWLMQEYWESSQEVSWWMGSFGGREERSDG